MSTHLVLWCTRPTKIPLMFKHSKLCSHALSFYPFYSVPFLLFLCPFIAGSVLFPFLAPLALRISSPSPTLSISAGPYSHFSHTPLPCTPPLFHTAQGLAETHTPLSPSLHPPHTPISPAHRGPRGRKSKRKSSICLSESTDGHLALTMYADHPWGAAFTGHKKWDFQ